MLKLKKIISLKSKKQIYKYILISVLGYLYVFFSLYLLVDVFNINKSIAFMLIYGVLYLLLYLIQLKYLFYAKHNKYKFIRFCASIIIFYLIANLFYNIGIYLEINYLLSTLLTVAILMPIRFLVSKFIVFKS